MFTILYYIKGMYTSIKHVNSYIKNFFVNKYISRTYLFVLLIKMKGNIDLVRFVFSCSNIKVLF